MKKKEEDILNKLKELAGNGYATVFVATVVSVDEAKPSCVIKTLTDVEYFDVRLKASIEDNLEGMVVIPENESSVLVARLGTSNELAVISFSKVKKVLYYGGQNGGLINIQTLITELGKTNEVVNALKNSLTGFTPVPNDGGNALKIYAGTQLSDKTVGDFSNMEDTKVLH